MRRAWRRVWWVAVAAAVVVALGAEADTRRGRREAAAGNCDFPSCCGFTEQTTGCRFVGNRCRCPYMPHRPLTFVMRHHHHPLPSSVPLPYRPAYFDRSMDEEDREKAKEEEKEWKGKEEDD